MEALKEFDIEELLKRQAMLDKKFDEKETARKRTAKRIKVAYLAEVGELIQELKNDWNYWKNSTKKINKQRVLEELPDCLHFLLSYLNLVEKYCIDKIDYEIRDIEHALIFLSEIEWFFSSRINAIMEYIFNYVGATEEEFLQVHHEKWLKNMNERTKGEY